MQRARRPRPRRRPEIRTGLRRRSCDWHLWRLSVNSRTDADDDGDDDSVSAESELLISPQKQVLHSNGIGIGEWPSFVPDANGKRERGTRAAYSLIPLVYSFNGCRTFALDRPLYFRKERGSKFESSQQILAGILFIIVWWPGKDIPRRSLNTARQGLLIDREGRVHCQHVRNGGLITEPSPRHYYYPCSPSPPRVIRYSYIAGRGSRKGQK